ncbi:hypothetical protein BCR33DRAFT_723118 [Rhizoclosmatium globosum]|uniref:Uncharacterized protein n=1 Tax=Rhizoclosmatium globosum TaxID=329046 RepID=A0A1Y2BGH6_9FUNG|nr:hypothetical protein BCR33DRAFT_723118 [Rhizoclosmatium globosum]|eukprot:ORY33912.1 hypothetical protein BCR33DRAFT_723118 [Rhizoclosmatium globosum]
MYLIHSYTASNPNTLQNITNIQTSGWVYTYTWAQRDNATWIAFQLLQLVTTLTLLVKSISLAKKSLFWVVLYFGLVSNLATSITGMYYLDCITFNMDPKADCTRRMRTTYVTAPFTFISSFWLLYYRKLNLCRDPYFLDLVVFWICSIGTLTGHMPCLLPGLKNCFDFDLGTGIGALLAFLYFEIWFLIKISWMTMAPAKKWYICQLSLRTGCIKAVYVMGSISYRAWGGNFYTNEAWNMGYCIAPLMVIDSVMSPKFFDLFSLAGGVQANVAAPSPEVLRDLEEAENSSIACKTQFTPQINSFLLHNTQSKH